MDRGYEIEHFGFTAEQSSLERKYFLQKIIRNALDSMVKKFNVNDKTSEFLSNAKEEVFENMWISMAEDMEAANKLDEKYFTIPDHVLLPSCFDQVKSYTEENEQDLDKQLNVLKRIFLENSIMLTSLNVENSKYKNFSSFVESENKIQQQLKETFNSPNMDLLYKIVDKTNNLTNNENQNY